MSVATSVSENYVLWRAVFYKTIILMKRYWFNTASQIATIYMIFAIVFFGGRAVTGQALNDSLGGIIVGFFLFTLAIVSYSGLSWDLIREAQWGTLEQLFMSPLGFGRVIIAKTTINVLISFLWGSIILVLMVATTGKTVNVDLVTVVPVLVLTLASAVGVGFVLGGLALLYKRIEQAFQLVQFVFIGFIAAPVWDYPVLKALPLSQGSYLLQQAMQDGVRLWEFPLHELGILAATGVVYFGVGYFVFHLAQRRARRLGVLGHY